MFGVLLNVGSSSANPNGRGRIFKDFTFEYLPIPETRKTTVKVPTYRELGFANVRYPDLPVHLDPEFDTFTYGHVIRGFGDVLSILKLQKNDALFFYATLQKENGWTPSIIGYFKDVERYDCRGITTEEIRNLKSKGFADNAHLKRENPHVDFLIKGGKGSKLLKKAFPLAEENNSAELHHSLKKIIYTATGKKIETGKPWFRWTLISNDYLSLLNIIE